MNLGRGPGTRRRGRWLRWIVAGAIFLLVAIGVPAWFLSPPQDTPVPSDAVVVIAGASDGRHQLGAQLVEEDGVAENFVVSNPRGTGDKVGSAHCRGKDRPKEAVEVWCLKPEPVNTAGEAMTVAELAQEEGWESLTVVTNRPHTRRVRTMFDQCTDLEVTVVSSEWVNKTRVPYHVAREIAGYVKFWVTGPCRG